MPAAEPLPPAFALPVAVPPPVPPVFTPVVGGPQETRLAVMPSVRPSAIPRTESRDTARL